MKVSTVRITNWKSFEDTGVVKLGDINVIVGRNNSGKSAFIRAIHLMQGSGTAGRNDVRLGATEGEIIMELVADDLNRSLARHYGRNESAIGTAELKIKFQTTAGDGHLPLNASLKFDSEPGNQIEVGAGPIQPTEPSNFIYTYLSKRKVMTFDPLVDRTRTLGVAPNLMYLVSKVARLANIDHPQASEYADLSRKVLGFRVSTHASNTGQQAGVPVGNFDYIPIESMGEGVSSLLGLITDLCVAEQNLFLIEEPENDIHPEGLKTLLGAIVEKSKNNQFIISTHSNIVTRHLAAAPNSKLFVVESDYTPNVVPTSTIREVERKPSARIEVLRQLGYELHDFDLAEGWLILEESSAEIVIRYLIPLFAPRLSRIRTVAAGGISKVGPTFEDFRRLFLFAFLEAHYKDRAWVVVDGDKLGKDIVSQLQSKYSSWPSDHFRTWSESNFEHYYPARFATQAAEVLAMPHNQKWAAKQKLHAEVKKWADEALDEELRAAFEQSAPEVISVLKEIDQSLFGR
jgi:predicted ATPase